MVDVTTVGALLIALTAIAPGYITLTLWLRNKTWNRPPSDLKVILQSLVTSLLVQIIASPFTIAYLLPIVASLKTTRDAVSHAGAIAGWAALVVIVIPFIVGVGFGRITDIAVGASVQAPQGWFQRLVAAVFPEEPPSAWDSFFESQIPDGHFLVFTMTDGSRLGGYYPQPSFAITSPQDQGVYVAQEWLVDRSGKLKEPIKGSRGFLIPSVNNVASVRVIAREDEPDDPAEGFENARTEEIQR